MLEAFQLYAFFQEHPKVFTDSRQVLPGGIFFALRGERFDGNAFALACLAQGAAYAVVDRPEVARQDKRCLLVEDTLLALQELARHHRRQFAIPVIAITGSNGKTTTKELVAAVLGSQHRTHFTQGNLNNHIGVPLSLLAMPVHTEVAIIEMGANRQGDIHELCEIAEPTHGLITNIGRAHLEGFGGLEGVRRGKSELYRYLAKHGGVVFINRDEPFLMELAAGNSRIIEYLESKAPSPSNKPFEVQLLKEHPQLRVGFLDEHRNLLEAQSPLMGIHNFQNIKTAIALGKYFKVPGAKIKAAIEAYSPGNMRSQWLEKNGYRYFLDAYNANPESMQHALNSFVQVPANHRVAVLGAMLELGESSEREHRALLKQALDSPINMIITVGEGFRAAAEDAGAPHFLDADDLKSWLKQFPFPEGTHFLLKGSRGNKLETLLD
jgi:UDP-N-acetylmuramoyl-tripeptide--D-alanyl-D-alanine ligase